jgi:predicted nucleic acid-binding protein
MAVLDASVVVEYLAGGEHADEARARVRSQQTALWAPHLVDAEVGHVLRRAVLAGELSAAGARAALRDLADLPLRRAGHVGLLERAWRLRGAVTFYDALYVALAERLGLPLITLDARLAGAAPARVVVDLIA